MDTRVGWNDMGYMDGSYNETMREAEEGSSLTRGGERFRKEKRQRTKQPNNDEGDSQDTPKPEEWLTQNNNIPIPLCTVPHSGRNTSLTPTYLTCQQQYSSSRSDIVGRRPTMVGDNVNLPLFHENKTKDPKHYWFLCETMWTIKQTIDHEVKKG